MQMFFFFISFKEAFHVFFSFPDSNLQNLIRESIKRKSKEIHKFIVDVFNKADKTLFNRRQNEFISIFRMENIK